MTKTVENVWFLLRNYILFLDLCKKAAIFVKKNHFSVHSIFQKVLFVIETGYFVQ